MCVYSMADIRMVFNGPFAHKEGPNYQWMPFSGKMPYPRPGTVSTRLSLPLLCEALRRAGEGEHTHRSAAFTLPKPKLLCYLLVLT